MSKKEYLKPPEVLVEEGKKYFAIVHTNKGIIKLELFSLSAPLTVSNFIFLAKEDYYNNIVFHRIIESFMIQTGCPSGNGYGGPGYTFQDELPPFKKYRPGIVAMANSGPNTNGSQFFICSGNDSELLNRQPNYTVFAEVIEGMDTVNKIAKVEVGYSQTGELSNPLEEVYMEKIEIEEK
ncbi:MAG: peptidylprolyl isomerase [Vulcanibacillus sp.]